MHNIPYFTAIILFSSGIYLMIAANNYFYKLIGLSLLQIGVLVFYIAIGKVFNAIPPVEICPGTINCLKQYSNPLPHVLMLTAIVVGFSTMSVGLALIYKIKKNFNTINESELDVR